MVVSLYICDIPQDIEKEDLEKLFKDFGGFKDLRIARDKTKQKIAFADYKSEEDAKCARDYLQGYAFPNSDKGMCIRISENTKKKQTVGPYTQTNMNNEKDNFRPMQNMNKGSDYNNKPRNRDSNYQDNRMQNRGDQRGYYKSQGMDQQIRGDPRGKMEQNYGYVNDRVRSNSYDNDQQPRMISHSRGISGGGSSIQPSFLHNPLVNSGSQLKMKSVQMIHHQDPQSLDQLDMNQNQSHHQESYILSDMISLPNNSGGGEIMSHLDQYILPQTVSNQLSNSAIGSTPAYLSSGAGVQSLQIGGVVGPQNSGAGGRATVQYSTIPANSSSMPEWRVATTGVYNQPSPAGYVDNLIDLASSCQNVLPIPKNATNTVYVEGIPTDASEREVAHIFRPYPGFKSVRLIPREKKNGEKVIFCFADFENSLQTTMVIQTLQGYRFDKNDEVGLHFSYAKNNNKSYKEFSRNNN